ncbi:MAG: Histidine kinase [Chloroflexi bacterium]|jgi:two-component system sensor histidine kinase UhpB|nr:Histidine kinase [Chloroflexota bacterium]
MATRSTIEDKASTRLRSRGVNFWTQLSLLQKIYIFHLVVILGGAIIGSWLTAQIAEAGKFNIVTFSVIIATAVIFSGAVNFVILKIAFRPFEELQKVISKVHTGNTRARVALTKITDPDVRQFTTALNHMLTRLEENAHVIQEDQRQLQMMTARVINAQENERKRIARELHDEASQSLTAMIMGLEAARQAAPAADAALQQNLAGLKELAVSTLEELRKLALDLRPTMLDDLGLIPAVRWLSRTARERGNLAVNFSVAGFEGHERLAPELETCLFRITQECLTNILKHANASVVDIKLEQFAADALTPYPGVRLTVRDDGRGFDRATARAKAYRGGHLGLFDIEERATLMGGHVKIGPANPNAEAPGTCTIVTLPLQTNQFEVRPGLNTAIPPYTRN